MNRLASCALLSIRKVSKTGLTATILNGCGVPEIRVMIYRSAIPSQIQQTKGHRTVKTSREEPLLGLARDRNITITASQLQVTSTSLGGSEVGP